MNREQAFDPVDVLDSFADQPATLTMIRRAGFS